MQFFAALALPALAAAGVIVARDASTILSDINNISSQLSALNSKVTAFTGNTNDALAIQTAANNLDKVIASSASDAQAAAPLNEADSNSVANAVKALQPDITSALNNIVSKKPQFAHAVFGGSADGLVHDDLVSLKTDTDYFGGNITTKLTPDVAAIAPGIISQIDSSFTNAITAFST